MSERLVEISGRAVVEVLAKAGHIAYFAGGWVRDMLLGHPGIDVDIATSATPEEVMHLFPKTVPLGLSFGSVVVVWEGTPFEVTTFRNDAPESDGRRPHSVAYSSPQEDAKRRDFTINGMFYDPLTDKIYDFVGGREDLARGLVRAIGDPNQRFLEDRLRMVRAVRFGTRFGFPIEETTRQAILHHAHTLFPAVAVERIWQEFSKIAPHPHFADFLLEMEALALLSEILPEIKGGVEIRELTQPIREMGPSIPLVLKVATLLRDQPVAHRIGMARRLKLARADLRLILLQGELEELLREGSDLVEWAHFYAELGSDEVTLASFATIAEPARTITVNADLARKARLKNHIDRLRADAPLLTSAHLMRHGIRPGIEMGELLRLAERIAIIEDLRSPEEVLLKLKDRLPINPL